MSGRITIDNLSDSLKEMISNSGSGLSEEQVLNLINENGLSEEQVISLVKDNLTGDLTQLSTTNKTNIVAAINELFQSANNGKELIASAIGEPLNAEDTFSAMSGSINGLLSTFKTNMMKNGVTVNSGDKFKALIDKIATLADNEGGLQYVTGNATANGDVSYDFLSSDGTENGAIYIDLSNLGFTPMFVIVTYNNSPTSMSVYIDKSFGFYFSNYMNVKGKSFTIRSYSDGSSGPMWHSDNNNLKIAATATGVHTYHAIGVGEEDTTLRDSLASILQEEGVSVTEEDDMASLINKVDEEFDRQVVPQGTATINDVVSGKTFINSTGQLLTGTASKGLATATGTVNVSSTLYTSKSFTINIDFTPTRLILIVPKVWYNSGVIEHKNVIVTNETTTLNAGPNENGTIKVSSMTSYSFNIQMKGLQIPECTITWIAIG